MTGHHFHQEGLALLVGSVVSSVDVWASLLIRTLVMRGWTWVGLALQHLFQLAGKEDTSLDFGALHLLLLGSLGKGRV